MERAEIVGIVESIFKRAGFNISALCCSRPSCFDYALSDGTKTLFVKSYVNICGISQSEAYELKKISEQLSATPLFVGEKVREKRMEDDTVYSRYDVYTVNPKKFGKNEWKMTQFIHDMTFTLLIPKLWKTSF